MPSRPIIIGTAIVVLGGITITVGIVMNNPVLILIGTGILISASLWLLHIIKGEQEQQFQATLVN